MQSTKKDSANVAEFIYAGGSRHASRAAILGDSGATGYDELCDRVSKTAHRLRDMGCDGGDRVLVAASDPIAYIASVFGATAIGAIAVPANPLQVAHEYENYVKRVAPAIAITDSGVRAVAADGNKVSELCKRLVHERSSALDELPSPVSENDVALIIHTSGSTGTRKAVAHTHTAIWSAAENITGVFGISAEDRVLSLPRPYHSFGLGFGLFFPLFAGASTIVGAPQLSVPEIARLIAKHRPTIVTAVPSALAALLKAPAPLDLSSVRFVISAGEALPVRIYDAFRIRFGIEVLDGMGSTETLTHFTSNLPGQSRPGSVGVALPGYELRLEDDDGRPVLDGVVGSLKVRGRTSMVGYWSGSRLDHMMPPKESFPTGDKLYRDLSGHYYYCGRDDDMIKVAGAWVSPNEVQAVLSAHPSVEGAFVTAHEGLELGRLVAYIAPIRGATITRGDILKHLCHLPTHMIPASIVFLESVPLTSNGKVNRRALPNPNGASSQYSSRLAAVTGMPGT